MNIDLKIIGNKTEKVIEKVWGKEIWLVNNKYYCSKYLVLNKGYRCSYHYHNKKTETFIILNGIVLMECNGEDVLIKTGDNITINSGDKHRFTGLENSLIQEISTHHEDSDSVRETISEKVSDEEFKELLNKYL